MRKSNQNFLTNLTFIKAGILSVFMIAGIYCYGNPDDPVEKKFTISGHIKDTETGEDLIGATIYINELRSGTVSNSYGFYSISLSPGSYTLVYTYIGYESIQKAIELDENVTIDITLEPTRELLNEVEIVAKRTDENIISPEMSTVRMDVKAINKIPALMGEVDIIKAIQLLPGVQSTSEGSSGFSVRGGNPDQNLILLDEATVYNASHFLGFFSVFNNDAIKDVKLYKGYMPPRYGGRLSSVLDVKMRDGNNQKFSGTGGIGLISSRLTLEAPIVKNKSSFIVSGRRTYADLFLIFSKDEFQRQSKMYFYDLNAKVNYNINENNRIYLSGYFGRDVFKNPFASMRLGNQTGTLRWNHLFSKKVFSNFTLIYSKYKYELGTEENNANSILWTSNLQDWSIKGDFTYYLNKDNTIRFGVSSIYHIIEPGNFKGTGSESIFNEYILDKQKSLESGIYISNEQKVGARFTFEYGLRWSLFQNIGPQTVYNYDENYEAVDSTVYGGGEFYNSFNGFEPRVGVTYRLNESSSVKASYTRTYQYLQIAQNSTSGTPLDVWFNASPNVKPQIADQVAMGYFKNFKDNAIETSVEVYYKNMQNTIDFKDHAWLYLNDQLEGELRYGDGYSYGLEAMVRIPDGRLNGWISYTYSKTRRTTQGINNGEEYAAPYDVPHDFAIVLNYELSQRVTLSANWVYATGKPVTYPTGRAAYDGAILPIYSDRNAYRMQDYHRLDLACILRPKFKESRKFNYEWVFSVYNAYNRHNTWTINFVQDDNQPWVTYAEKTYLFGIIPAITWNFKF